MIEQTGFLVRMQKSKFDIKSAVEKLRTWMILFPTFFSLIQKSINCFFRQYINFLQKSQKCYCSQNKINLKLHIHNFFSLLKANIDEQVIGNIKNLLKFKILLKANQTLAFSKESR